jgi:hypothetical protein
MSNLKKVSFDYDETLSEGYVENFAKELIDFGFDVYIITARSSDDEWIKSFKGGLVKSDFNNDIWETCKRIDLPKEKVIFTAYSDKIDFIKGEGFIFHLDDSELELKLISDSNDSCSPINVKHKGWEDMCRNLIGISIEDNIEINRKVNDIINIVYNDSGGRDIGPMITKLDYIKIYKSLKKYFYNEI